MSATNSPIWRSDDGPVPETLQNHAAFGTVVSGPTAISTAEIGFAPEAGPTNVVKICFALEAGPTNAVKIGLALEARPISHRNIALVTVEMSTKVRDFGGSSADAGVMAQSKANSEDWSRV